LKVANFLNSHPKVKKVLYPLLLHHPNHELMVSQSTGFTGMLSFYLKEEDNFDKLCDFAQNLKLFKFGTSLGGVDSLLDHYGGTMRIFYNKEQ
jgi:cystathionine beta-lyase/cystathionine gamma-synthase